MLHGFSRLQKWNLAKQVIDGREVDVAAQVGKKNGVLLDRLHFILRRWVIIDTKSQRAGLSTGRNTSKRFWTLLEVTRRSK